MLGLSWVGLMGFFRTFGVESESTGAAIETPYGHGDCTRPLLAGGAHHAYHHDFPVAVLVFEVARVGFADVQFDFFGVLVAVGVAVTPCWVCFHGC